MNCFNNYTHKIYLTDKKILHIYITNVKEHIQEYINNPLSSWEIKALGPGYLLLHNIGKTNNG